MNVNNVRDGKLTTYDKSKRKSLDVDHILSLEHHPEFAHDLNNLETLCIKCHNKKEKRFIKKKINGKTKNGKYPGQKNQKRSKYLGNGEGLDFAIILKIHVYPLL